MLTASDNAWTITLNTNGTYTFRLLDNTLGHGPGNNGQAPLQIEVLATATDGDGDVLTRSFSVSIVDDVTLFGGVITPVTLFENDLSDGTSPGGALSGTGQMGTFRFGADDGDVALSVQNGPAATWDATTHTLTANDNAWTVTFNANGTYTFSLLDNTLAHGPANIGQSGLLIDLLATGTDGDGDVATTTVRIQLVDDAPVVVGTISTNLVLDEDDLTDGNDSAPKEDLFVTGNLDIRVGADGGNVELAAANASWDGTTRTLTAGDGSWKIELNSGGTYTFTLLDNTLAHTGAANAAANVQVTATATDGDGDVLTRTFNVSVADDAPVINAAGASSVSFDEDDLADGNSPDSAALTATGRMFTSFSAGADGGTVSLSVFNQPSVATWDPTAMTLTAVDGSWVVTAHSDSTYTAQLLHGASHLQGGGENQLILNLRATVTDGDGDVVNGGTFLLEHHRRRPHICRHGHGKLHRPGRRPPGRLRYQQGADGIHRRSRLHARRRRRDHQAGGDRRDLGRHRDDPDR